MIDRKIAKRLELLDSIK